MVNLGYFVFWFTWMQHVTYLVSLTVGHWMEVYAKTYHYGNTTIKIFQRPVKNIPLLYLVFKSVFGQNQLKLPLN
jgi:acyl-CoA thioesterase FadM